MSLLGWTPGPASVVWLEPNRAHAGGQARPLAGPPTEDQLAQLLTGPAPGTDELDRG